MLLAAQRVGASGKAMSIDMTPQMIERSRSDSIKSGINNVEFHLATIDDCRYPIRRSISRAATIPNHWNMLEPYPASELIDTAVNPVVNNARHDGPDCVKALQAVWREMGAVREDWIRKEFMRLMRSIGQPSITMPKILRHTFATILQDANVDPLVRNELMGHSPASRNGTSLGMTGVYTHTRPETKRQQLEAAFAGRPALMVLQERLDEFRRG